MSTKMVCPSHRMKLIRSTTKWGGRYDCPQQGCDVMCWEGSTSTPANQATRDARQRAHAAFDLHWHGQRSNARHRAYRTLSRLLGMAMKDCHIGMMGEADCERVVMACEYGLLVDVIAEARERQETIELATTAEARP